MVGVKRDLRDSEKAMEAFRGAEWARKGVVKGGRRRVDPGEGGLLRRPLCGGGGRVLRGGAVGGGVGWGGGGWGGGGGCGGGGWGGGRGAGAEGGCWRPGRIRKPSAEPCFCRNVVRPGTSV